MVPPMPPIRPLTYIPLCILIACGGTGTSERPSGKPQGNTQQVQQALQDIHQLDEVSFSDVRTASDWLIQAVGFATQQSQSSTLVLSGTVDATNAQAPQYSPQPVDSLVVKTEKLTLNYRNISAQGDFQDGLQSDHQLNYEVSIKTDKWLQVQSLRSGSQHQVQLQGTLFLNQHEYQVDLNYQGEISSEVDLSGSDYLNNYRITGIVNGGPVQAQIDESWKFRIITAKGDGRHSSAQSTDRNLSHRLSVGGDTYQWQDVYLAKRFRDGRPSQVDNEWTARGQILKNGQSFGTYNLDPVITGQNSGYINFVLQLPNHQIELEQTLVR